MAIVPWVGLGFRRGLQDDGYVAGNRVCRPSINLFASMLFDLLNLHLIEEAPKFVLHLPAIIV